MKRLLFLFLLFPNYIISQTACGFHSNTEAAASICNKLNGLTSSYTSNIEAELALEKILTALRIPRNFALVECNGIENCIALTHNGTKYILYDKYFMKQLADINELDDFVYSSAKLSVLAHEIGHHVYGHTDNFENLTLKENRRMELEADKFSGEAMYKLGASLKQAQMAVMNMTSENDDTYSPHPRKSKRLEAIRKGFSKELTRYDYDLGASLLNCSDLSLDDNYNLTFYGTYKGKPYSGYAYEFCSEKQNEAYYIRNNKSPSCVKTGAEKTFRYFENGKLISIRQYISEDFYYGRGKYVDRFFNNNGSVRHIEYWKDGIVKDKYLEKGDGLIKKIDGLRFTYNEDGSLSNVRNRKMGELHGWSIKYSPSIGNDGETPNIHYVNEQTYWHEGKICANCVEYNDFANFFSNLDAEKIKYIHQHQFKYDQVEKRINLFYHYYNLLITEGKESNYLADNDDEIDKSSFYQKILDYSQECLKYLSYDLKNADNSYQFYEEIYRLRGQALDALGKNSCNDYKQACLAGHFIYSDYDNFCKYHNSCY